MFVVFRGKLNERFKKDMIVIIQTFICIREKYSVLKTNIEKILIPLMMFLKRLRIYFVI